MRFPTSTRIASSASATSWCAWAGAALSGSISGSPPAGLLVAAAGVAARAFPPACLAALLALPLLVTSARRAFPTYEQPRLFVPAIRSIVGCYAVAVGLFIVGLLLRTSP